MLRTAATALLLLAGLAQAHLFGLHKEIKEADSALFSQFQSFVQQHQRQYSGLAEARQRFQIFKSNQLMIQIYQQNDQASGVYGQTQFMDLSPEEFKAKYLPAITAKHAAGSRQLNEAELSQLKGEMPEEFNWVTEGLVTPVKNQGQCGSCWAFSVTANVEGQWKKKTGKLVDLAPQQLLDCDEQDEGCNGGYPPYTYDEIIRLGGLESEADYPYIETEHPSCLQANDKIAAYINDSVTLPKDEPKIQEYLFKNGPLSIGVNADPLQFYEGGIHHPSKYFCSPRGLNHAVLLVGYGMEGQTPYWIIKNSWGKSWGEKGYYRMFRGANVCGVTELVTSAIVN